MGKDAMPSSDINPGNALQRIEECQMYMTVGEWAKFEYLYRLLAKFQDIRVRGTGKMRDDDEFTLAWNGLRANSVDSMLKNLESAQSFEGFLDWMQRLSDIIKDPRCLWNILHTEVQPTLKITLEQSHEIAAKFFTPEMLFSPAVFGCTLGVCLLLNVVSALVPALRALRHPIMDSLNSKR